MQVGSTALAGIAVTLYGTVDPALAQTWWNAIQGARTAGGVPSYVGGNNLYQGNSAAPLPIQGLTASTGYVPGIPASSWNVLEGPSSQSGTGTIANPITPTSPWFTCSLPLTGVRAVVTTATDGAVAGTFHVAVFGIP